MKRLVLIALVVAALPCFAQPAAKARPDSALTFAPGSAMTTKRMAPFDLGLQTFPSIKVVSIAPSGEITIYLSDYQRRQLADYARAEREVALQRQTFVSAIIGGVKDPGTIGDWSMALKDSAIVLTPPAVPTPKDPETPKSPARARSDTKPLPR